MNKSKKILLISIELVLLVVLAYVTNIINTPSNLIVFKGENFEYNGMLGVEAKSVSSSNNKKIIEKIEIIVISIFFAFSTIKRKKV